uniref:NADP-dependent oxidoreductase domain-containing protein n=1 Tax=Romanomermis culicivorax TaxID=13658 RepID=A0A915JEY1_ROMCU
MFTIAPKVHMPRIGLGTFRITGSEQVHLALDRALKLGYRFFDTAQYYENEQEIGEALQILLEKYNLKRSDIFLTTKLRHNIVGETEKSLDDSLKRLKTDYVDLFLIHYPAPVRGSSPGTKEENMKVRLAIWSEMEKLLGESENSWA